MLYTHNWDALPLSPALARPQRVFVRERAHSARGDRRRRCAVLLYAVGRRRCSPGPAHRRAVVADAPLSRAAARAGSSARRATAVRGLRARRGGVGLVASSARPAERARTVPRSPLIVGAPIARRVARLADLAGMDDPLLRRGRSAAARALPRSAIARRGTPRRGRARRVVLVPLVRLPPPDKKEQRARRSRRSSRRRSEPGDLVLSTHPEQVPGPPPLPRRRPPLATTLGIRCLDPQVIDWRDVVDRLEAAPPQPDARSALLDDVPTGRQDVHRRHPASSAITGRWQAPWTRRLSGSGRPPWTDPARARSGASTCDRRRPPRRVRRCEDRAPLSQSRGYRRPPRTKWPGYAIRPGLSDGRSDAERTF